jgi:hypothetical protein
LKFKRLKRKIRKQEELENEDEIADLEIEEIEKILKRHKMN